MKAEKKYKVKEEVKEKLKDVFEDSILNAIDTKEVFIKALFKEEALEEVPQRVELELSPLMEKVSTVYKKDKSIIRPEEKIQMEKALNGELLDIESLLDFEFKHDFVDFMLGSESDAQDRNFVANVLNTLKEYLKQTDNETR